MTVTNPVVWFEVMGQNTDKLRSFYADLLGWRFEVIKEMHYGTVEAIPTSNVSNQNC